MKYFFKQRQHIVSLQYNICTRNTFSLDSFLFIEYETLNFEAFLYELETFLAFTYDLTKMNYHKFIRGHTIIYVAIVLCNEERKEQILLFEHFFLLFLKLLLLIL